MSIFKRTKALIDKGRTDAVHTIPTVLPKFNEYVGGVEQGVMTLVGAESGVGKTKWVRQTYMYDVYNYFKKINDTSKLDVLFIDFSLEITPERNCASAISRKIWEDYHMVVPMKKILKNATDEVYRIVGSYEEYFSDFEKKLFVIETDTTPSIYHDYLMEIAKKVGKFEVESAHISGCKGYTLNNPSLYVIIVVDTVNLAEGDVSSETIKTTIDRIGRLSVWFRNKCNFIPVIIQQFNAEISAVDRSRYGIKTPLLRDFEDSKRIVKDSTVVLGLYDPTRHWKPDDPPFYGYDVATLKSWMRSLHIMKNREGETNIFIPLKFAGAVETFTQLPKSEDMTPEQYQLATRY